MYLCAFAVEDELLLKPGLPTAPAELTTLRCGNHTHHFGWQIEPVLFFFLMNALMDEWMDDNWTQTHMYCTILSIGSPGHTHGSGCSELRAHGEANRFNLAAVLVMSE